MQRMLVQPDEGGHALSSPPQRPGTTDCPYYVRTGMCDYGTHCRFNHPPERMMDATSGSGKDDYPERVGEPECQFYMKTGTCKFGSTCKYHHPREKAGILGKVSVNRVGYIPWWQAGKDCCYYMQTGTCKFGATCKFNHPWPTISSTMNESSMYASAGALSVPSSTTFSSWPLARAPYMAGFHPQSSCFAPLLVPPEGLVSTHGWISYQGQMRPAVPISPLDMKQYPFGATAMHGAPASQNILVAYNPNMAGTAATGLVHSIPLSKEFIFPERPGQLECKYYIKTGDCKFGATCKYDHPKRRIVSLPNCTLSPTGFPLRPGIKQCPYYMQNGTCKFGVGCKFDHPMISSFTNSHLPKPLVNCHLRIPFPRILNSSIDTHSVPNVQQPHKDKETALTNGKASTNQAVDTEEVRESSNGADPEAST
eukprot:c21854_g2_i1 orf=190-1461(+)